MPQYNNIMLADGADITQGKKADAAVTDPTQPATGVSLLKGWLTGLGQKADAAWASGAGSVIALLKAIATTSVQLTFGAAGSLITGRGLHTALNQTVAGVVKGTPGRIVKAIVIAPGTTSGAFTINDCATTGAAAASNAVWTLLYNATTNVAGATFDLDIPCATGIVLSAVPGAGSPIIALVYS